MSAHTRSACAGTGRRDQVDRSGLKAAARGRLVGEDLEVDGVEVRHAGLPVVGFFGDLEDVAGRPADERERAR
jgi:hypothetical protein